MACQDVDERLQDCKIGVAVGGHISRGGGGDVLRGEVRAQEGLNVGREEGAVGG